jgi:hypothetical protein
MITPPPEKGVVTLHTGMAVPWPASPLGFAQVEDLMRTRVRLAYRCKNGRVRRPVVSVRKLTQGLLFPIENPFERACLPKVKQYVIDG